MIFELGGSNDSGTIKEMLEQTPVEPEEGVVLDTINEKLNYLIENGSSGSSAYAYGVTGFGITNVNLVMSDFDGVELDNSKTTITITKDGMYTIFYQIDGSASSVGAYHVYVNNNAVISSSGSVSLSFYKVYLQKGDTVKFDAKMNSTQYGGSNLRGGIFKS